MEAAETSAGRIRELNEQHTPETEEYGVTSLEQRLEEALLSLAEMGQGPQSWRDLTDPFCRDV